MGIGNLASLPRGGYSRLMISMLGKLPVRDETEYWSPSNDRRCPPAGRRATVPVAARQRPPPWPRRPGCLAARRSRPAGSNPGVALRASVARRRSLPEACRRTGNSDRDGSAPAEDGAARRITSAARQRRRATVHVALGSAEPSLTCGPFSHSSSPSLALRLNSIAVPAVRPGRATMRWPSACLATGSTRDM